MCNLGIVAPLQKPGFKTELKVVVCSGMQPNSAKSRSQCTSTVLPGMAETEPSYCRTVPKREAEALHIW